MQPTSGRSVTWKYCFFGILALEAVIYSLYGLPWGPSFYTMILSAALFFSDLGAGVRFLPEKMYPAYTDAGERGD
ncbi:hypothetical protein [Sellimonas intestinalis]|uniref:hypothetical protein n=1 Tax=Sellimonas intestinalis TaxID=1653434 RepID=UPI0039926B49